MAEAPQFNAPFLDQFEALLRWRRDVRQFSAQALAPGLLEDLIASAKLAPSVGLSEPWRFVIVQDPARRAAIRASFAKANAAALQGYAGEKASRYAALKLEGFEAPSQLAVYCQPFPAQGSGLGRQSMPETAEYSVVSAIQILWLQARAKGVGVGWVSILDPQEVSAALDVPSEWKLVAYLCLGYPKENSSEPELQRQGWESRRDPLSGVFLR